jgi:predicted PurR-regulated permease PerM
MSMANPSSQPPETAAPRAQTSVPPVPITQRIISTTLLVAFALVVIYYLLEILQPFFGALAWAAILATALYPLYAWIEERTRRPRLASALTCLLITMLVVLPVMVLLGLLAAQSVLAYRTLAGKITHGPSGELEMLRNTPLFLWAQSKLMAWGMPPINLANLVLRAVKLLSAFLVGRSSALFAGFASYVFSFFVVFVTLYFFFLHGPQIMEEVRWLFGLSRHHNDRVFTQFKGTILASLVGSLVSAILLGTFGGFTFLIFGIPAPLLWGAVMAFLSLVPVIGTALIWVPVVIYYLSTKHVAKGIGVLVVFVILITVVDNVVKPMLMQRQAEIHPLWIFLGVVGGVHYFGLLGFVLGPLVVTGFMAMLAIIKSEEEEQEIKI